MIKPLITLLVACTAAGCTHAAAARDAASNERIQIVITADPQLNQYDKKSHALLLCLYLLKDASGFRRLAQERSRPGKLLECRLFDETVVSAGEVVVQPGEMTRYLQHRDEAARYLGVAAGYYSSGKRKLTELSRISPDGAAPPRSVSIHLGPQEIRSVRVE